MTGAENGGDAPRARPVVIEVEAAPGPSPAEAPPVPELTEAGGPPAMVQAAGLAARPGSALGRWFMGVGGAILATILSLAAWDYVTALLARAPLLGGFVAVLFAVFLLILVIAGLRELAAFHRLARIDRIQKAASEALAAADGGAARKVVAQLTALYGARAELAPGRAQLEARAGEVLDADALLALAERALLGPLDAAARIEVEAAARQVATVTAVVPLALADVAAALTMNLRMIRRVAEIYGGRAGTFGSWRLTRTVMTHLVATGAVAVGDDLIGSVAGGGVLSKVSRRFGEGVVNGALTARVGVAAIEVCRPLPFGAEPRPSVTGLVRRALAGLFSGGGK